jgi:hypothetical protein
VTVFCELVIEGTRLLPLPLGKAEMVICETECAEVWLPDTVANVRLGFWVGRVSFGRAKPSLEQAIVRPVIYIYALGQHTGHAALRETGTIDVVLRHHPICRRCVGGKTYTLDTVEVARLE